MGLLRVIDDAPGFCKATFQGPQGSGKTFTAVKLAARIHTLFGSTKPIAFYDTEIGSDYVASLIEELTGHKPLRIKSRAFGDLMEAGRECVAGASDVFIADSITHVWRELQAAHMEAVNADRLQKHWQPKSRMDIQDIMKIKERWQCWPDFFLNSPLHMIVCGREGSDWGNQENEETGKLELVQVGKKMKVEAEFGYEASLMVSMSIRQNQGGWVQRKKKDGGAREAKPQELVQVATVLKDRFDELNGQTKEMPDGEWFDPFLNRLNPKLHQGVNTDRRTPLEVDSTGQDRAMVDRDILCEKIESELVRALPGQTAAEEQLKADVLEACLGSRSWTEITRRCPNTVLAAGYAKLNRWMIAVAAAAKDGVDLREAVASTKAKAFAEPEPAATSVEDDKAARDLDEALDGKPQAPAPAESPHARLCRHAAQVGAIDAETAATLAALTSGFKGDTDAEAIDALMALRKSKPFLFRSDLFKPGEGGTPGAAAEGPKNGRAKLPTPPKPNGTAPRSRHPSSEVDAAHEREASSRS